MAIDDSVVNGNAAKNYTVIPATEAAFVNLNGFKESGGSPTPIAICSMAFRLPAGVATDDAFWDVLANGKDLRGPIPTSRFNVEGFDGSLGDPFGMKMTHGYFLNHDLSHLDTSFFPSISKNESGSLDPQLRQLLEITRECLENAGETNYRGKRVGCYIGAFSDEWSASIRMEPQQVNHYAVAGLMDLFIANRISHSFDLKGPSMVIKTGCSASAVALHEACRALQVGDCDAAIVGGVNFITGPGLYTVLGAAAAVLSPDGSCKTFDAAADGYARGEAANVIFVKRLKDAIRDGNPIRAVIRGIGSNCDGKGSGVLAPDSESQAELVREVYQKARLDPNDTTYVECHGTGTPSGDPAETTAFGQVFGQKGVYIGSVKPNVGHSEAASGLTSLIKAVLCLEKSTIAPNIKFNTPNPLIPFEKYRLKVPTRPVPWPQNVPRRASISSFGIGGSNVHMIVDAYVSNPVKDLPPSSDPQLLLFSANSQAAVAKVAEGMLEYFSNHEDRLSDMAYTLACRREKLPIRSFAVVSGDKDKRKDFGACVSPPMKKPSEPPTLVMVFTGQGAQWPMMGAGLLKSKVFRQDLAEMDVILQACAKPPSWSIIDELSRPPEMSRVYDAELSQPLCAAVQIGLINALGRAGITPSIVVGHSSGEIAAAFASRALTMRDAILIAYYRGLVSNDSSKIGGMAAIGLGLDEVSVFLGKECGVTVAAENSPQSTTISGDLNRLTEIVSRINQELPDVMARKLKVDMAYHSHHMIPLAGKYEQLLIPEIGQFQKSSKCAFYSTVTGSLYKDQFSPAYWANNMLSCVKFNGALKEIIRQKSGKSLVFLEVGPHSQLQGPLRQICVHENEGFEYIPALIRGENCTESLLSIFGRLFQYGVDVDFATIMPKVEIPLSTLPAYPWDHTAQLWSENTLSKAFRTRRFPRHSLLGVRVGASAAIEPLWRNILNIQDVPWLQDHNVDNRVVFPFAGYIAMAGEAIRQIHGDDEIVGYTVKHIGVINPLMIPDDKQVEMVTTFRPQRLTDSLDSQCYEFMIMASTDGNDAAQWKKHCHGRVEICHARPTSAEIPGHGVVDFPRKVSSKRWYEAFHRLGHKFGPQFNTLSNLEFATTTARSRASILNHHSRLEFMVDPATIDGCLQLSIMLSTRGYVRKIEDSLVPTVLDEITVFKPQVDSDFLSAEAWSDGGTKSISNGVNATINGELVLRLRGLQASKLPKTHQSPEEENRKYGASRLEWVPDFDFMNPVEMVDAPEMAFAIFQKFGLLISDADARFQSIGGEPKEPHLKRFKDWVHKATLGDDFLREFGKLSTSERETEIRQMLDQLAQDQTMTATAESARRIWKNLEALYAGETNTLELLGLDLLQGIYTSSSCDLSRFVKHLSDSRPGLRILEVGAGTGGATDQILRNITVSGGNPSYEKYTFTDVSAGFFEKAKERFSYAPNMHYKTFDITQSPASQDFTDELGTYDLIIAFNVIHATPSLKESLTNIKELLRPDGHLVMTELLPSTAYVGYIFGTLPGWWAGGDDRPDGPAVNVDRWDAELKASGYLGVEWFKYDAEEPNQHMAVIGSRPVTAADLTSAKIDSVTIVCLDPNNEVPRSIFATLDSAGIQTSVVEFGQIFKEIGGPLIFTIAVERGPFSFSTHMQTLQKFFKQQGHTKALWITHPTQFHFSDTHNSAELIAAVRGASKELDLPNYILQIDQAEIHFNEIIKNVFAKVCRTKGKRGIIADDKQFITKDGVVMIGRFETFMLESEIQKRLRHESSNRAHGVEVRTPGMLNTLVLVESALPSSELGDDEVEIDVKAWSLNFRDVLFAMGIIPGDVVFCTDGAGVVRKVGARVEGLVPGDRVAYGSGAGSKTRFRLSADFCVKIPETMSFQEGATISTVFSTALYSLVDVAQITSGQTVLIHSACGGLGHASVSICKMLGAEIFVTVGSDEKVQYCIKELKIPRNRIFNSRDKSFVEGIMRETNGQGVDVVLNSLSGELLHASWDCVAEFGKMVEVGKRDLIGSGNLAMKPFLLNRTYTCVDLAHMITKRPKIVSRLIKRAVTMYCEEADIHPIPYQNFPITETEQAFRSLQRGNNIGKTVITIPEDISNLESSVASNQVTFDPVGSYLLTGGLGGIGRSIATWMVEKGARHLILLSPSASSPSHSGFLRELESMNCKVTVIAGKAQDLKDVQAAIASARGPVKGVFHLALKLEDDLFTRLKPEDWSTVIAPKANGVLNIHKALIDANQSPDFLVLSSSMANAIDSPGQSNYIAANLLMESFARYRRSIGLPASVLAICPIGDVGYIADRPKLMDLYSGMHKFLHEQELLVFIEHAVLNQQHLAPVEEQHHSRTRTWTDEGLVYMGLLPPSMSLSDPSCTTIWRGDPRMASFHNYNIGLSQTAQNSHRGGASEKMIKLLEQAQADPSILKNEETIIQLAIFIGEKLFSLMMRDDGDSVADLLDQNFKQMGLDSLVLMELRGWWREVIRTDITPLELASRSSLRELGLCAAEQLYQKYGSD